MFNQGSLFGDPSSNSYQIGTLSKVVVTLEAYGGKGDWNGTTGTDNITPLTNLINAFPNGASIHLQPGGNYYISNENSLPNQIVNFEFIGSTMATITFGTVSGTNTSTVPSSTAVPNFVKCKFKNITFSAPNATGFAIFTAGSSDLKFDDCVISDVKPLFLNWTSNNVFFRRCKFIAPNTPAGTCLQTIGNVPQNFVVEECEWNFAPNQGTGSLISATNDGNLIGDYWFINNRFLTDNLTGYYIDAAIDLEPSSSTVALRNVHIESNEIWNGKIYMGSCEELWLKKNAFRFTSVCNGGASGFPLSGTEAYTTAPIKYIEISDNVILCDDYANYYYKNPIGFNETNSIERLLIKNNILQYNGAQTSNPNPSAVIYINATRGNVNYLDIDDNTLYYTSVPVSKGSAIHLYVTNTATVNRIRLRNNRLSGVSGATNGFFWQTNGGTAGTIKSIELRGNDITDSGLTKSQFLPGSNNTIQSLTIKDNPGYNPVGNVATPVLPGNNVGYTNTLGCPVRIAITGGTVTQININGVNTGLTSGMVELEPNETITLTYSVAPTWVFVGM